MKLRNQCDAVIRAHFCWGTDGERNGENLLISHLGAEVRNFFDVGANHGQWVKEALPHFSRAEGVCFEPLPSMQAYLRDALSDQERVTLKAFALGDVPAVMQLFECDAHSDMSSLVETKGLHGKNVHTVEVSTVDAEVEKLGWTYLDFLKVDVEGYDFYVLKGARKTIEAGAIGIIQFEYSSFWRTAGSTLLAARNFLEERGYEVYLVASNGLVRVPYEPWGEYFGYSNYVAVSRAWKSRIDELVFIK